MVIICREFAVTALRLAVGAGQGVVMSAGSFGKVKTAAQVVMVMALIAFDERSALDHRARLHDRRDHRAVRA